ncbi:hypothetical protein [Chryseobacterium tongliaoense]|uniref:hypothetical protein n=1 Tax=Chryseobacterium tongliaoense TaxID=3240933 RepID=UPI003511E8CC
MRQTLSVVSSVAMVFFLTGCQNESFSTSPDASTSKNITTGSQLVNSSFHFTETSLAVANSLDENGFKPDTEITKELIDKSLAGVEFQGKELVTVEMVNKIISYVPLMKQSGLKGLSLELQHSEYFAQQMGLLESGQDISSSLESTEFSALSQEEKDLLKDIVYFQQDYIQYSIAHPNSASRVLDPVLGFATGCLYAIGGAEIGSLFGPWGTAAGAVIGFVVGFFVGGNK